jgi:alkylhydroperoxidase family enzyme
MLTHNPQRFGPGLEPVIAGLAELHGETWKRAPDPALLELCRLRVAALLGARDLDSGARPGTAVDVDPDKVAALDDWPRSALFDERERAFLDFTEQFVTSVRDISDDQIEALCAHDDEASVCAFVAALYVLELTQRTALVAGVVLNPEEVTS